MNEPIPDATWRRSFRRRMTAWFDRHAVDFPWRRTCDPYAVWISEIMLQQTQVGTVIDYFNRFLKTFPDVGALAEADEERVLRLWEGLGYYRRARQLHAAAKKIVAEHNGVFPSDPEAVRRLPGIGRYTAGAILSIAFDLPTPILEANTIRLHARLLGLGGDLHTKHGEKLLWAMAEAVLPRRGAGKLNQSLMELGREVCKGKKPQCEVCPVAMLCRAAQQGLQDKIPRPKAKPRIEEVREAAVVVRRNGRILLVKQKEGGRWAGLWDFPRFGISMTSDVDLRGELTEKVLAATGYEITLGEMLKTLRHGVTRFRITLECYEAECLMGKKLARLETKANKEVEKTERISARSIVSSDGRGGGKRRSEEIGKPLERGVQHWYAPGELADLPLSSTGRKIVNFLDL